MAECIKRKWGEKNIPHGLGGCVIVAMDTDTNGPADICENCYYYSKYIYKYKFRDKPGKRSRNVAELREACFINGFAIPTVAHKEACPYSKRAEK